MQAQIVFKTIGKMCCDLWLENHQNIQVKERPCLFEGFFPICIPRHEDLQALGRSFLWSVYVCMCWGATTLSSKLECKVAKAIRYLATHQPFTRPSERGRSKNQGGYRRWCNNKIITLIHPRNIANTKICIGIFRLSSYYGLILSS